MGVDEETAEAKLAGRPGEQGCRVVNDLGASSIYLSELSEDEILGCLIVAKALQVRADALVPGDRVIWYDKPLGGWCRDVVDACNDVWERPSVVEIRFLGRSSLVCRKADCRFYRTNNEGGSASQYRPDGGDDSGSR